MADRLQVRNTRSDNDPVTTLLEDPVTLLPGRAALLDVLGLRRPAAGPPVSGVVLLGLVTGAAPVGATALLDVTGRLSRTLLDGEWLARSGPAEFAVVTEDTLEDAAVRLVGAVDGCAHAGLSPVVPRRDAAEVLRLAGLGLAIARLGAPGQAVRYPA